MEFLRPSAPRTLAGRRRLGMTAAAAKLLGASVDAAVPLQRHSPALVLGISLAELLALVALLVTASLGALATLVVVSLLLTGVAATNKRQILVVSRQGNVLLSATATGWPAAVAGPADRQLALPEPNGLGVAIVVDGRRWWIDRSSYRSLLKARAARTAADEDQEDRYR